MTIGIRNPAALLKVPDGYILASAVVWVCATGATTVAVALKDVGVKVLKAKDASAAHALVEYIANAQIAAAGGMALPMQHSGRIDATEELKKAIQAAGQELQDTHGWGLDGDGLKPVGETLFAKVVLKHVAPVLDPARAQVADET